MFRSGKKNRSDELDALKKKAYQLGFDVGENNHIENVGWVKSELTALRKDAENLGAMLDVSHEYIEGKRQGAARRSKHTVGGKRAGQAVTEGGGHASRTPQTPKGGGTSHGETYVERISPAEGLKATISVMKFVAKDPVVKKDLDGLFAGVFDIQEKILDMKPGPDRRKTFEKCLQLLTDVGWIENCEVFSFDERMAVVTLRSTTAIAEAFGDSEDPMCQPVCNLLEAIGRKTFEKSVTVTEIECVAQGMPTCKFEVSPRQASPGS